MLKYFEKYKIFKREWWEPSVSDIATEKVRQFCYKIKGEPLLKNLIEYADPVIIGGQGGSGTRLVAQILKQTKQFGLLFSSSASLDSFSFRYCRLNSPSFIFEFLRKVRTLNYDTKQIENSLRERIEFYCQCLIKNISLEGRCRRIWGWKEPRTMYWLPFLNMQFPNLKFIHVVRDVRNIRSTHIEGKNELYQAYFNSSTEPNQRERFEKLWAALNSDVLKWSERNIFKRYRIVRIEDLTGENKEEAIKKLLLFLGIKDENVKKLARLAKPLRLPDNTPRFGFVEEILKKFDYL